MSAPTPLSMDAIFADPELAELFAARLKRTGHISNSLRVMARVPPIVEALDTLVTRTFFEGRIETPLKMLMFMLFSGRWGCQYCQAHALTNVTNAGVSDIEIEHVWDFETSEVFDERRRAALSLARDSAMAGQVEQEHYVRLRRHFDDAEIVEMIAVLGVSAFLNTWNSTLGTELEPIPLEMAQERLSSRGWTGEGHLPTIPRARPE